MTYYTLMSDAQSWRRKAAHAAAEAGDNQHMWRLVGNRYGMALEDADAAENWLARGRRLARLDRDAAATDWRDRCESQ